MSKLNSILYLGESEKLGKAYILPFEINETLGSVTGGNVAFINEDKIHFSDTYFVGNCRSDPPRCWR